MKKVLTFGAMFLAIAIFLLACSAFPSPHTPPITAESELVVYFIDVGQGDSALVVCDGAAMLIDGGNTADSDLLYTFLKNHDITHLDYIVATHAHEDHVGGLAGALNYAAASVALCPVKTYNTKAFSSFVEYLDKQGVAITVPQHGDTFWLGGAGIQILGPINTSDEPNNTSIVLKLTFGATSFLFTADAEREEEQDILAAGYDLTATVLKVGHHGSDTSTTYPFLRETMPQYAIISCGQGNSYGHPHETLLSRLRDAGVTVLRTDMQGTIICISDGKTINITTERNAGANTNPTLPPKSEAYYIGNINSQKLHRPACPNLPLEKNRVEFDSPEAAIDAGYSPCGTCKPF